MSDTPPALALSMAAKLQYYHICVARLHARTFSWCDLQPNTPQWDRLPSYIQEKLQIALQQGWVCGGHPIYRCTTHLGAVEFHLEPVQGERHVFSSRSTAAARKQALCPTCYVRKTHDERRSIE